MCKLKFETQFKEEKKSGAKIVNTWRKLLLSTQLDTKRQA